MNYTSTSCYFIKKLWFYNFMHKICEWPSHALAAFLSRYRGVHALARQKNPKRHFFRAIGNSFHEVTWIGLEPHQIFSSCNISTNMVARGIQSFGQNGLWLAGWLSNGQKFFVKFAQTCDEQMLKISSRYLDPFLCNRWFTKNLL